MGDFFHGLRRKTGCVTLAIALMFMGAWVRSLRSFDEINCPLGNEYAIAMTSWKDALAIRIGWVLSSTCVGPDVGGIGLLRSR